MKRKIKLKRETKETQIKIEFDIDGRGISKINTQIGFLDHMLELFAKHGLFDLNIEAKGDINVDIHHINEDIGLGLGEAFKKTMQDKKGISRFGLSFIPMDEALTRVVLDISGRPHLIIKGKQYESKSNKQEVYDLRYTEQFLSSFVNEAKITLDIEILSGQDRHHIIEAIFKGLGRALDEATRIEPRIKKCIPSTKGKIM